LGYLWIASRSYFELIVEAIAKNKNPTNLAPSDGALQPRT